MKFQKTLFVFRRDLRLEDNLGLLFALKHSKEVIAAFIFVPEQIKEHPYFSRPALQFMIESLKELKEGLEGRLHFFYGSPAKVIAKCIQEDRVDCVVVNRDYTPYSISRDKAIQEVCDRHQVLFHTFDDLLLCPPGTVLKSNQRPYTVFTPFYRKAQLIDVPKPQANPFSNYCAKKMTFEDSNLLESMLPEQKKQLPGGRKAALKLLQARQKGEQEEMEQLPLSPYLKFNVCSVREVYHALPTLRRSLYWRDFFTLLGFYFPHVFEGPFHKKYQAVAWENDPQKFQRWCEGKTGFPFVDAGMRQLNETGYLPNRVRMVVASFLIKDLHIDWRWGERYFATHLIDYDPAVNNGNWQWVAGTGCDAQPYFRVFNPWLQAKKFDKEACYIKKWVKEVEKLSPHEIHRWHLSSVQKKGGYCLPMVDHAHEAPRAVALMRSERH